MALSEHITEKLLRSDYRVIVTGSSGWLGLACLHMLSRAYGVLFLDRVFCFGNTSKTLNLRNGLKVNQRRLVEMGALRKNKYILFHFACVGREQLLNLKPNDYVAVNRAIADKVLEAAKKIGVQRIFVASSGAVYSALEAGGTSDSLHPYATSKLEEERLFEQFARRSIDSKVLVARLFNLSGPYINKLDTYALSSFIQQARERDPNKCIKIRATKLVLRSYIGIGDLLMLVVSLILDDGTGSFVRFDTAGDRQVELLELAEIVRSVVNPLIRIERPDASGLPDRYVGNISKLRELTTLYGIRLKSLEEQVRETARYLDAI